MAVDPPKKMTGRRIIGNYVMYLLVAFVPFVPWCIVMGIAKAGGVQRFDEAHIDPCVILGVDISSELYAMGMISGLFGGLIGIFTVPIGFVWSIAFTYKWVSQSIRARLFTPPANETSSSIDS